MIMKIANARLPENIEASAEFILTRRSEIIELSNGFEERNTPQAHHRRLIRLRYSPDDSDAIDAIRNAWAVTLGPVYAFRVRDWADFKTSASSAVPANDDQNIGTGDGAIKTFQLAKTVSFGDGSYTHPIKAPVSGSVLVAVDGVAKTEGADFTVDYNSGVVTFLVAPGIGLAVTAGCKYDIWARFKNDELSVQHLIYIEDDATRQVSQTGEIELIEVLEP